MLSSPTSASCVETASAPATAVHSDHPWTCLQCVAPPPLKEGGHSFYLFVDHQMDTFDKFLKHVPPETPGINGWRKCVQCRKTWPDLSRLGVVKDGQIHPAYLSGHLSTYGEMAPAVTEFQKAFRAGTVRRTVMFQIPNNERHDAAKGRLGKRTAGVRSATMEGAGQSFIHLSLDVDLPPDPQGDKINQLLIQEVELTEQFLGCWSKSTVSNILDWYEDKGQDAPGYKQNIGGLRWFSELQTDLVKQGLDASKYHQHHWRMLRRVVVIQHLVRLLSGQHPDDALGAVHIFASGSNLAVCRYCSTPDTFWSLMNTRYNPITYRQPTAAPKVGQVNEALKMIEGDTTCFEREHIRSTDPRVQKRTMWVERPAPPPPDQTRITAEQLLAGAKPKGSGGPPKTCFDQPAKGQTHSRNLTPDEFQQWLTEQPAGSRMEWSTPSAVNPIQVGVPITAKGLEMTKREAGWVLPGVSQSPSTIGMNAEWLPIERIVHHPSRWTNDDSGLCNREKAIVSDGFVVQTKRRHTWAPSCSCLFAEFFRGEFHRLNRTRQELHRRLRIRLPDGMHRHEVFQGCLISVGLRSGKWALTSPETFRVTRPDGSRQTVTVS